ncbi:serine/threonine protein kinase [Streptomyces parvulus]|uniref:Serine/threonine protein kinase n=2 Tax=Streptomyces parvulus TaxID=146923 RepID=A0A369V1L6_9ACTN|nr:serine/threonine protein kinase [Streptomyces parvulus]
MYPLQNSDPTAMGRYRLIGRLGSGGMGSVYLGRTPGGRPAAVKVINSHLQHDPAALERFRREVETLGTVRNAFTAALIDAEVDTPPFWMATEYVPGPTLADAVEASGPFPVDLGRAVLAALAEGLADVHVHGVLHRDIKPQNIILSATGPQLIDFGIARSDEMANITQVGAAIGTPGFMAPETLTRGEAGPPSDVFALGVTMAYCLTGRPPYGQGSLATVSYRTVHEEMDLAGVPAETAELIARCGHKDPVQRPAPQRIVELCDNETDIVSHPAYQRIIAMASASAAAAAPPTVPAQPASHPSAPTPSASATLVSPDAPTRIGVAPPGAPGPAQATAVQTRYVPPSPQPGPAAAPPRRTGPAWLRRMPLIATGAAAAVAAVVATAVAMEGSGSGSEAKDPRPSVSRDAADPGTGKKPARDGRLPQSLTVRAPWTMEAGQSLEAAHVKLVMQEDGNLVARDERDEQVWEAGTSGRDQKVVFQEDGNLVVQDAEDRSVWTTHTSSEQGGAVLELRADGVVAVVRDGKDIFRTSPDPALPQTLTVQARRTLQANEFVQAAHVKLLMQEDGNLVAYDERNQPTWASRTSGENYKAVFQEDGNLVVYTADDKPVWATNTGYPEGGAVLELRADGAFSITQDGRELYLSSDTSS